MVCSICSLSFIYFNQVSLKTPTCKLLFLSTLSLYSCAVFWYALHASCITWSSVVFPWWWLATMVSSKLSHIICLSHLAWCVLLHLNLEFARWLMLAEQKLQQSYIVIAIELYKIVKYLLYLFLLFACFRWLGIYGRATTRDPITIKYPDPDLFSICLVPGVWLQLHQIWIALGYTHCFHYLLYFYCLSLFHCCD